MATYIPGITDYIPQFQPFQPDYNFLGNQLQNAQSKYDSNYKELSNKYGTLLNSPMLRQDNIQQRDEFFKMIDGDIKKISGMDLSLQQNVDAADKVFDSFYKNKNLVKDMVYTKEYHNQLQTGENYRNCIDQEKCGGKYSDEARQALDFKAEEFTKASKEDAMKMSPGRFTPFINMQEKAMKYIKDLTGKDGGFGISTVTHSPDGRYLVTTTNGGQLTIPLTELMMNQYGQDQAIQDMYATKAYVTRKQFVQANAAKFGSEDLAEDEYFKAQEGYHEEMQHVAEKAQNHANETNAKKKLLEAKIKKSGSTGDDDLLTDFLTAGVDATASADALTRHDTNLKLVNAIKESSDRSSRRQRVDNLYSQMLMGKQIHDAAGYAANMTGKMEIKEDPYAKSYYDFTLDIEKQVHQADLNDRNEYRKHVYDMMKDQIPAEAAKRGSPYAPENLATPVDFPGMVSKEATDENKVITDEIALRSGEMQSASEKYVDGFKNLLVSLINSPNIPNYDNEKKLAQAQLASIFGPVVYNKAGQVISPGYDTKSNKFIDKNGISHNDPKEMGSAYDVKKMYNKIQDSKKSLRSLDNYSDYFNGAGAKFEADHNNAEEMTQVSSQLWLENNKAIKNFITNNRATAEILHKDKDFKLGWDIFIDGQTGNMLNKTQFAPEYAKRYAEQNVGKVSKETVMQGESGDRKYWLKDAQQTRHIMTKDELYKEGLVTASKVYNTASDAYHKLYTEGTNTSIPTERKPIIKPLNGNPDWGGFGGRAATGYGESVAINSSAPASSGTSGLVSLQADVENPETKFSYGITNDIDHTQTAEEASLAKEMYNTLVTDVQKHPKELIGGKITYANSALSTDKYVAVNIIPDAAWAKNYKAGKDKTATWADNDVILSKGVTMYIPKSEAKNQFVQRYQTDNIDLLLQHRDKNVAIPGGGNINISKRRADGSLAITGSLDSFVNGKIVSIPLKETILSKDAGGKNTYNGVKAILEKAAAANYAYKQGLPLDKLIFDPEKLINDLNRSSGNATTAESNADIFRQMVSTTNMTSPFQQ